MKKLDFPNRITVELTNQCNVSCTFCPRQTIPMEIGFMSMDLYRKIIDEAAEHLPIKLVIFFRGESLLHPNFVECIEYAKKKGIGPIQFATNAYALKPEISNQLVDTGIDFISFSIDTLDAQIYRQSRMFGDLDESIKNVIYLSNLCKSRAQNNQMFPTLQISTIDLPEYRAGQEGFINFWKKYVDVIRVYYEHDDSGRFRDSKVQKRLEEQVNERKPCRKVFTDMLIYWNGTLALCNYDWSGGLKGLNIKDITLQEAWDSDFYQEVRKMQWEKSFTDDIMCKECQHWRIDYMPEGYLGRLYYGDGVKEKTNA